MGSSVPDAPDETVARAPADDRPVTITRSEERLVAATERIAVERVRLQKFVVEEEQTFTVTVRREEVRLVREPVEGVGALLPDPPLQDREFTMVLSEERVVVTKETVPVERVRLVTQVVTDERPVEAVVQSERIEYTSPDGATTVLD